MNWIILILARLFEIVGVNGMQQIAAGKIKRGLIVLLVGFSISLSLLSIAMETIPLGVAYAVWTGIGTAGSIIIGMLFYNDSADRKRIFYLSFIFITVIGL